MCGRTRLVADAQALEEAFGIAQAPELDPSWNLAPSERIAVIRTPGELEQLVFGWIPSFAPEPKIRWINARAETVHKQSAFREAFRKRRCLVVVDAFYEWRAEAKDQPKQPFMTALASGKPFALAGIWERWTSRKTGEVVDSCAIITEPARPPLDAIHDRQPVILAPSDYGAWLDPTSKNPERLLKGARSDDLVVTAVSSAVNNARNKGPECNEPAA